MKSRRSQVCDISHRVKDIVWARDKEQCILCGNKNAMPNAHYIPRSKGGLGIPENIVTLCQKCHTTYDQSVLRPTYGLLIKSYLDLIYPNFKDEERIYKRDINGL